MIAHMLERMDEVTAVNVEELRGVGHFARLLEWAAESAGGAIIAAFQRPGKNRWWGWGGVRV
ncbi:MAG: hypothetical protein ACJ79O_20905 [Myxococcales bacterium]